MNEGRIDEISKHLSAAGQLLQTLSAECFERNAAHHSFDSAKLISLQEEERRRVARDLHDGPVQTIANIVLRLDLCERLLKNNPASLASELLEIKAVARDCLEEIRKFIYDLRPMAIDDLGFASAMRQYVKEFTRRTGVDVTCNISASLPN